MDDLKKVKKNLKKLAIILIMLSVCAGSCEYINKKVGVSDDNFFEEFLEAQIENEIGLDIDLSPSNPE